MSTDIELVKSKLDIVDVVSRYITLKKRGRHHVAPCPFHQEKTPSFVVSPELQIYKCFGCGKGGDIFTFVQEFERVDFHESLEILAKLAGVTLTRSPALSSQESQAKQLLSLHQSVTKFYHHILLHHPLGQPALNYLTDTRKLTLPTIKTFQIGFSPADSRLLHQYLLKEKFAPQLLVDSGIFIPSRYSSSPYDRFSGRLTFPLIDYRGRIIGFSGRILPNSTAKNLAKYINSPETILYHKSHTLFGLHLTKDAIRDAGFAVVVEGEFDLISPFQAGIKNFVAPKGTAFTTDQLELLRRYTDTLVLAFDSDFAGNQAAIKSIELAEKYEFTLKVLELDPKFKDPDEAALADPKSLSEAIVSAPPVWDYLLGFGQKQYDLDSSSGKSAFLKFILPFISRIINSSVRSDYIRKISLITGNSLQDISRGLAPTASPSPSKVSPHTSSATTPTSPAVTSESQLEQRLLVLIFATTNPKVIIRKILDKFEFQSRPLATIASTLASMPKFDPYRIQELLPPELHPQFHDLYLKSADLDLDSRQRHRLISKTVSSILSLRLEKQISHLSQQIGRLESQNQDTSKLEAKYHQLLSLLHRLQS